MALTPLRRHLSLAVILGGTALIRLRLLTVPLERDEGEYAYMGQLILRGEVPYLAAHNMKLPGVYYAYAGIMALLGETDVAIRLGLLAINLLAIVLVYLLGRRLLDATAGLVAAATYAVLSVSPAVLGFTANTEHFVVLPMLGGVLLLAAPGAPRPPGSVLAAGLLLGLAFVMKQPGGLFVAFGGLVVVLGARASWRRMVGEALVFSLAAAMPYALVCLAMWRAGAFAPFWFWTVTYAHEYVTMIPLGVGLAELRAEIVRIPGSTLALWLLAGVGVTTPWWDQRARRAASFLGLFTGCSFLAVCPGLRFTAHYFILLLPAVALLAGAAMSALARRAGVPAVLAVALPVAAVGLTLVQNARVLLALPPAAVSRAVYGGNPFPEAVEIGRVLATRARPDDRIGVIGSEPQLYFYAGRRAATSFIYMYPLMEPHPFAEQMQREMIAQLERERPRFLVLVNVHTSWSRRPDSSLLLMTWAERTVSEHYQPIGVAEIVPDRETVYRWDADAAASPARSALYVVVFERRA